jgi:hypothetical protein
MWLLLKIDQKTKKEKKRKEPCPLVGVEKVIN